MRSANNDQPHAIGLYNFHIFILFYLFYFMFHQRRQACVTIIIALVLLKCHAERFKNKLNFHIS